MTTLEAYNVLQNRVEWKLPFSTDFSYLTFPTPESGRFLQEEHISVRIPIIYETIVDLDITDANFQTELENIKKKAILHMLQDVFYDAKEIKEDCLTTYLDLFDYAIILKLTNTVLSDILNSARINHTEKVTDDNLKRWFIDLNGLKDTNNGVYVKGFMARYKREIIKIRKVLFITNKKLTSITTG